MGSYPIVAAYSLVTRGRFHVVTKAEKGGDVVPPYLKIAKLHNARGCTHLQQVIREQHIVAR